MRLDERGGMLLETVIAIFIMTVVGLALIGMIQKISVVSLKAREQHTCARMAQTGFSRLKNMDFYYLFTVDSASASYGGLHVNYPYYSVLNGLKTTLSASAFDRYTIGVTFMRRDTTDSNSDGSSSDLAPFTDANGDLIDDVDSAIRYFDQNTDGDYYETYVANGRTVAEQPDTHIKQVALTIYRRGRVACSQTELVSLEQFMPGSNPSSESSLSLMISTPPNNAFLYRQTTTAQSNSRSLPLAKPYPSSVVHLRADTASWLTVTGEATPLATVNLYVGSSGILDTLTTGADGTFAGWASNSTLAFVEGNNRLTGQAIKSSFSSPLAAHTVLLDYAPPTTSAMTPTGATDTGAPFVAATLSDLGVTTTTTSGICPDVITMKVNGSTVAFAYNSATGLIVWVDSATDTVPIVSTGSYTAYIEAGDYAGYKTTQAWTFTVSYPDTDNSSPSTANKTPSGASAPVLPVISVRVFDNQSGIIPTSIRLLVDGGVVVDSSNIGAAYDPATGTVSYTPSAAFAPGSSHLVEIRASHFATDPADKIESVDTWNFTVQ